MAESDSYIRLRAALAESYADEDQAESTRYPALFREKARDDAQTIVRVGKLILDLEEFERLERKARIQRSEWED